MKWFKFYGQDFLTDSKLGSLNPIQRLMWVGLLCIASQDEERTGIIRFLSEDRLMDLCGVRMEDFEHFGIQPYVTLVTMCNMGLLQQPDKDTIIITNFHKKQTQVSTSAERVKAWRDRNRAVEMKNDKVTDVTNVTLRSNGRVDKSRIDINTVAKATTNKKMKNYNETDPSDSHEKVIDSDSNEAIEPKKSGIGKAYKEVIQWAENRRGSRFIYQIKQMKALKTMREADYTIEEVKARWIELEGQDFYKKVGVDFMGVCSSFDKKPLK